LRIGPQIEIIDRTHRVDFEVDGVASFCTEAEVLWDRAATEKLTPSCKQQDQRLSRVIPPCMEQYSGFLIQKSIAVYCETSVSRQQVRATNSIQYVTETSNFKANRFYHLYS